LADISFFIDFLANSFGKDKKSVIRKQERGKGKIVCSLLKAVRRSGFKAQR